MLRAMHSGDLPATEPSPQPDWPAVVLRATGLRRAFGGVRAVDGVDLTVRAGEIYGFLGVNGAGKTTAIRLLMGIIKPDAGTIELLGQTARRTTIAQRQAIGYVSQEQTFYPWMTARRLGKFVGGLYPTWDTAEFERLLRVLEVPPERKVAQLSSGMKVKLALALALAPRPALLILDEPTAGLDPVARREFLEVIHRQARQHQRTTFFSSHLIDEVERVADHVGIIHDGRMKYEGSLETLRASVRKVVLPIEASAAPPPCTASLPEAEATSGNDTGFLTSASATGPEVPGPCNETSPVALSSAFTPAPTRADFQPPPEFEILRDETRDGARALILRAPPAAWESFQPPDAEVQRLSLEDIFIALVGSASAAI